QPTPPPPRPTLFPYTTLFRSSRRQTADRHRREAGDRRELGQMQHLEARNLILRAEEEERREGEHPEVIPVVAFAHDRDLRLDLRSEERRVGKECRSGGLRSVW